MNLLTTLLLLGTTALAAPSTSLTLRIPPSAALPNPNVLPPSTHATLSALQTFLSAPLSTQNTFIFHNVTTGSYLLDVFCATYAFAPLRVDVSISAQPNEALLVRAWETYRGNDWDNKGEAIAIGEGNVFETRVMGGKAYFMERSKCEFFFSPLRCWRM
jgi:ER membrane protein complex subunit 7